MLVDTDVLIWYMRGHERARRFLEDIGNYCVSAVTYMELVQGMRNKGELMALRRFLKLHSVPVVQISEAISNRAIIYVEEHFLGHALQLADALIAATAVDQGYPLATANAKHYRPVRELSLVLFEPTDS